MKTSYLFALITIVVAIPAFLSGPNAPLGSFWRPSAMEAAPTAAQMPFFIVLAVLEAATFGAGVAFLILGRKWVQAIGTVSKSLANWAHLAIVWVMGNWWAHDSLHIHNGMNLQGLLYIEYGFHVTLMAAGVILAIFWYRVMQEKA